MASKFGITGVWFKENKTGSEHISNVLLHEIYNNTVLRGEKRTKDEIVALLRTETINTLRWNYQEGIWTWGAKVTTETRNGIVYLRTVPDNTTSNNLDNILNMVVFLF